MVGGALHVPRARERESPTPYPPGLVILGFRVLLKINLPRSLVVRAAGGLVWKLVAFGSCVWSLDDEISKSQVLGLALGSPLCGGSFQFPYENASFTQVLAYVRHTRYLPNF